MTFRVLAVPVLVLCGAVLFALITVHPKAAAPTAQAASTCGANSGNGVIGLLPEYAANRGRVIVQILPAVPYGGAYVDAMRARYGLGPLGASLSPQGLAEMANVMRYAHADQNGRFVCRPLDPGRYFAVATTPQAGGVLAINVAAFDLGTQRGLATIDHDRFRPLQDFR